LRAIGRAIHAFLDRRLRHEQAAEEQHEHRIGRRREDVGVVRRGRGPEPESRPAARVREQGDLQPDAERRGEQRQRLGDLEQRGQHEDRRHERGFARHVEGER